MVAEPPLATPQDREGLNREGQGSLQRLARKRDWLGRKTLASAQDSVCPAMFTMGSSGCSQCRCSPSRQLSPAAGLMCLTPLPQHTGHYQALAESHRWWLPQFPSLPLSILVCVATKKLRKAFHLATQLHN